MMFAYTHLPFAPQVPSRSALIHAPISWRYASQIVPALLLKRALDGTQTVKGLDVIDTRQRD